MPSLDRHSLIRAVFDYKETVGRLLHARRNGAPKVEKKRLSARLGRIRRRYFPIDGEYRLSDTLYRTVFSDTRIRRKRRKR